MPRKSKKPVRKQPHSPTGKVVGQVGQILLPMIAGIAATKADLTEWVYEQGLTALHLLLREDAVGCDDHRSSALRSCSPSGYEFASSRACPWAPRSPLWPLQSVLWLRRRRYGKYPCLCWHIGFMP